MARKTPAHMSEVARSVSAPSTSSAVQTAAHSRSPGHSNVPPHKTYAWQTVEAQALPPAHRRVARNEMVQRKGCEQSSTPLDVAQDDSDPSAMTKIGIG